MQKHTFFVKQIFFQDEVEILPFFDDDDDNDDDDDYSCNSVNFQARTSRFGMEVDQDNIYQIMLMMMTIMMMMRMIMMLMMMMMTIAVTQSIFKLGPLDFAWKQIYIIYTR